MPSSNTAAYRDVLVALFRLAQPYKTRFALIVVLAVLATGADLLQPLIYRTAINDVAGLFVGRPISRVPIDEQQGNTAVFKYEHREKELENSGKTLEPHRPGFVAPRTGQQALTTLLEAAALLFLIGVAGYFAMGRIEYGGGQPDRGSAHPIHLWPYLAPSARLLQPACQRRAGQAHRPM